MKLHVFFVITHGIAAAVVAFCTVGGSHVGGPLPVAAAAATSVMACVGASWLATCRIRSSLVALESVVADHETTHTANTGLEEFDRCMQTIAKHAVRWETAAATTRRQMRELQSMMKMLTGRDTGGEPTSSQLCDLLAALGNSFHSYLVEIERSTAEVERYGDAIIHSSDSQNAVALKTTSCAEQLSTTSESISTDVASASAAFEHTSQVATTAVTAVTELIQGIEHIRSDSQSLQNQLWKLCDSLQPVTRIVQTIRDTTSRAKVLGINASLLSIHDGDHAHRQWAIANDAREVAARLSADTDEIAGPIEQLQLAAEASLHEARCKHDLVEAACGRAASVQQTLTMLDDAVRHDVRHLHQLSEAASQQLQLVQSLKLAVEQISKISETNRDRTEKINCAIKALSIATPPLGGQIKRMRSQCLEPATA